MIALLQRVNRASVVIDDNQIASIGSGLLAFIGIERGDNGAQARRMLERLLGYRVFPDDTGRMNRNLREAGGELLLVPQFTLAADTRKGNRPSFTPAAPPDQGRRVFDSLCAWAVSLHPATVQGIFGAHMHVHLINDGPVTFWLQVAAGTGP